MSRETDLSTKQSGAQAPSRIPHADGIGRWPQGAGTSSGQGPQETDSVGRTSAAPPRLKLRRQFLRVAEGTKAHQPSLVAQARKRDPVDSLPAKVGFTASKKVGNSVARNRARRRLREAVRHTLPAFAQPGCDYVFVARQETLSRQWPDLLDDVKAALISVNRHLDNPRRTGSDARVKRGTQHSKGQTQMPLVSAHEATQSPSGIQTTSQSEPPPES